MDITRFDYRIVFSYFTLHNCYYQYYQYTGEGTFYVCGYYNKHIKSDIEHEQFQFKMLENKYISNSQ